MIIMCIFFCRQTQSLKQEIDDLQKEFEFDREDYLDTIRKQEKETKFWKAVAERMQVIE